MPKEKHEMWVKIINMELKELEQKVGRVRELVQGVQSSIVMMRN